MKRFVQAALTLLFFAAPYLLKAQSPVKNYSFVSATGTYTPITGTNSTAVGDDASENGIPIGFNFFFGGRGYTHFSINTNGFIKFGIATTSIYESTSYSNFFTTDPTPAPNYPCIAAFWDNNHRNNGSISYTTTGAVGSRVLTVQWDGVNIGGNGATSATLTASFQIKLSEGTNLVKIIYSNNFDAAGPLSASIGLMDATSYLSITPGVTPTTSSTTANNAISDVTNLKGKEYTLTPSTPLCSPTSALTISNITSSGALFTANAVSGASSYRFSFNTTGEYPTSSTSSSTPSYTASGLLPNTRYYAMAQAVCPGGNGSGWYTTEFTTACATLTLPYFQNFDTVTAPAIPPCTSTQDLNGGGAWGTTTAIPYSVPNCLTYTSSTTVAANDWFYTPPMTLSSGTTYRLTFYYRNSSGVKPEKLEVKCGTGNNAAAMTNLIYNDANILNTNYKVVEQTFTVPSSGTYYVGFHDYSNADQLALNIDDIRIAVNASCNPPTLLNVSIANGTSGVASWTAPSTGTVTSYQYAITSSGTPPASGTSNAGTSVNISGLTAGQLYYLHVRSVCTGNSAWSTLPFYTPCPAVQVPYTESFDANVTVPGMPNCITAQDVNGGSQWSTIASGSRSAPNAITYDWDPTLPGDDWFFTRAVRLNAGSSYKISYYTKVSNASRPEKLEVKYGTANNAAGMTDLLISDANMTNTTYQLVSKSFTPATTGDYYFGFHVFSNAQQGYLYIDDINVDISTDCGTPTNLAVATNTASSGTASWSPSSTGTVGNYEYAITTSATPPATGTTVTTNSVSFSGLQPLTQYYLHVKSFCVSGLYSTWASYPFTTPCVAVDLPYVENFTVGAAPALPTCMSKVDVNGGTSWQTDSFLICVPSKALVYRASATLPGDDWVFTPGLNLTAGVAYELLFDHKSCASSYTEKLEVKYGMANAVSAMTNTLYSNFTISSTDFQTTSVRFTPTTSGVYYIGFHAISPANQASFYLDNIKVDVSHFCGQPGNPAVNFTNNTDGTVSWTTPTEGVPATYQYAITNSNIPPATGTGTTDTFATFNGLQVSTRYFLHVRTNCSDGNFSAWTTFAFSTACLPFAIPYYESFDNVPKLYLGNCMTSQDLNGGTTWITDSIKPRSAPNAMTYHYAAGLPGNDWAYTPGLSVVKGVQYRLSFYYKGRSNNYRERLEVKYGNAANADSMATLLFSNTNIGDTTYQLAQADFTATRTGVLYIGFHVMSNANQWDLNIDDIKVDFAPGCGLPRDLAVNFATDSTGTASWAPALNGPPTGHQYAITSSRVAPASGTAVTEPSAPIANLSQGVKYYLHVRTACSGGQFSAWVTDSFYMPCYGKTIPYIENFDGVAAPSLAPCISKEDLNGGTTWNTATTNPKSAPNAMVYRYHSTLPANDWFYTAPLKLTGGTNYRLTFYYKGRSSAYKEKLEVKLGTGNNVNSMSELLFADTNIVATSYLQSATDFASPTTGVYYIGFHAFSAADQFDLNIDDIKVDIAPDCGKPANLSVAATGNTTGTAKWSPAATGTVTGYEYVVSNTAALPASGNFTTDTSAALTGLIAEKPYYLHVRTVCSQDQFSLWSTIPFTIPCAPYAIPYTENFDAVTLPLLPTCMLVENANGGKTWRSNEMTANSGNFSMYYVADTVKADDWFYTPALDVTAGTSYRLSFYYRSQLPDVTEKLEVKYGNTNNASAMTHLIMKDTTINFETYKLYRGDFVPDAAGPVYVGFHAISDKNKSWLFVDDIKVDVSPNCSHPVNITAHLTHGNGGTITWSPSTPGTPTGYEYIIDTINSNPTGAGMPIADSVVTLDGTLTLFKQYYFHVRSVCANGISTWETIPFYTLPNDEACNALNLLLDGPQSCGSTVKATAVNDPALAPGCATNSANFTVWYKYTPAMSGTVLLRTAIPATNNPLYGRADWYTVTGNCADSGSLHLVPGTVCRSFGQTGTGDIDSLRSPLLTAGVTYYIMISGIDYNSGDFCLRLISLPAPPCTNNITPANGATVTPPLGSNIKLIWSKTTGATGGYDVVLDTINPPTAFRVHVTDTAYVYTGLSYNKTYYWYVVPKDTLGNSSGCTSNITSFTTTNPTICLPLTTYGCAFADSITYFSLKGEGGSNIRNYSGNYCGTGDALGYSEYMALPPATLSTGTAYTGFIKTADAQNYSSMWIDFNDNGYFEPTEKVLNNLQVGPTPTLYSILIPANAATGTHRLRIRNIYSAVAPDRPLAPCNYYPYSETEDYAVTITNTPAALRPVASGIVGNCQVVSVTTIDSASNNINAAFVPVLDSNNHVVAYIYPAGNTLGRVSSSLYVHNSAVRQNNGAHYLNRNITIKPAVQPVTHYKLRMFYKTAELDSLIAQEGSRVEHDTDLVMTKTRHDSCRSGIADYVSTDTTLVPSVFGDYNGDKFVEVWNIESFSTFYLNGRHRYRFSGSGNWSNRVNWANGAIPPTVLPAGDSLVIDHAPGGECILDVPFYIPSTGSIIVGPGKRLVIPGDLKPL